MSISCPLHTSQEIGFTFRHVPRLGIQVAIFWCRGRHATQSHQPGPDFSIYFPEQKYKRIAILSKNSTSFSSYLDPTNASRSSSNATNTIKFFLTQPKVVFTSLECQNIVCYSYSNNNILNVLKYFYLVMFYILIFVYHHCRV